MFMTEGFFTSSTMQQQQPFCPVEVTAGSLSKESRGMESVKYPTLLTNFHLPAKEMLAV